MNETDSLVRWWYLPSWLGLDAPCVVSTWTVAISIASGRSFEWVSIAALFMTVWSIYLLDRMIDVKRCNDWQHVTGRMRFGKDYRWLFRICLILSLSSLLVILASGRLSSSVVLRGLGVGVGLCLYVVAFVVPVIFRKRLFGKEFGVGLFFALGAFAVLAVDSNSFPLFVGVWFLVAFNCLVIAARERETDALTDPSGASQWWSSIDRDLYRLGLACAGLSASLAIWFTIGFSIALTAAFLLLVFLHARARTLTADGVRAVADFCLFTPWIWFLFRSVFPNASFR